MAAASLVVMASLQNVVSARVSYALMTTAAFGALNGLALAVPLGPEARVLDAGCGLGAGLVELRREYPGVHLAGVEWSWPLRFACAWRCRDACVARADLWTHSWAGYDLVYLFQRPESLGRALDKARREMRPAAGW